MLCVSSQEAKAGRLEHVVVGIWHIVDIFPAEIMVENYLWCLSDSILLTVAVIIVRACMCICVCACAHYACMRVCMCACV